MPCLPRVQGIRQFIPRKRWDFVRTFLERDLLQLGVRVPATTRRRFWTMLAHYHAQVWNSAELARAFGVTAPTVRHYLDTLTAALVLRQLPPWFENLGKRQVKAPKVYLADSGLLHTLLAISTREALEGHPKVGASWEGFALGEVITRLRAYPEECLGHTRGGRTRPASGQRNAALGFCMQADRGPTADAVDAPRAGRPPSEASRCDSCGRGHLSAG